MIDVRGPSDWGLRTKKALAFDDVLLRPQYSEIETRNSVEIGNYLDGNLFYKLPIISSPMDTVTESTMAATMNRNGGLGIIHRYNSIEEQVQLVKDSYKLGVKNPAAAIGISKDCIDRAKALYDAGARILCIDVAHGHHIKMKEALRNLRNTFGRSVHIMAGNVATLEGFDDLSKWGADSIRVGIGGGSICSTRMVSGHGIPTLQSIMECSKTQHDVAIIADGGIKTSGDIVKALAAGADFVMIGSMLAGTDETPGEVLTSGRGKKYKVYRGMASRAAQENWRGKSSTPEGVSTTVTYKGPVTETLDDLAGGIKSGFSYSGSKNLAELQAKARFIIQTSAGQYESSTHIMRR